MEWIAVVILVAAVVFFGRSALQRAQDVPDETLEEAAEEEQKEDA